MDLVMSRAPCSQQQAFCGPHGNVLPEASSQESLRACSRGLIWYLLHHQLLCMLALLCRAVPEVLCKTCTRARNLSQQPYNHIFLCLPLGWGRRIRCTIVSLDLPGIHGRCANATRQHAPSDQ